VRFAEIGGAREYQVHLVVDGALPAPISEDSNPPQLPPFDGEFIFRGKAEKKATLNDSSFFYAGELNNWIKLTLTTFKIIMQF
jgi:hypothetical protein